MLLGAKLRDPLGPAQANQASYHRFCLSAEEIKIELLNLPDAQLVVVLKKVIYESKVMRAGRDFLIARQLRPFFARHIIPHEFAP